MYQHSDGSNYRVRVTSVEVATPEVRPDFLLLDFCRSGSVCKSWPQNRADESRIATVKPFPLVQEFLNILRNDSVPGGLAALKEGLAEQQKMDAGQQ